MRGPGWGAAPGGAARRGGCGRHHHHINRVSREGGRNVAMIEGMRDLFSFPNPVNEKAARVVAGVVFATVILILATSWYWLLVPLAYGFWARVLTGPTLSPLGWTAQNVIAPRLGPKRPTPGPPKRFAQGMGAAISTTALILALVVESHAAADVVLILLLLAAGLESIVGLCLGCKVFALLMRLGVVPQSVCDECADITLRWAPPASSSPRSAS